MSGPEIITCEQNSPEWFAARLGLPTASEFKTVMAKGKTAGAVSLTRQSYLYRLAGEVVTGQVVEGYTNHHMERGHLLEGEARDLYAFERDVEPEPVGFVRNGRKGCSPDSFIGTNGGLEIKTKLPALVIECMMRDDPPPEHKQQLQGFLWVCEREWVDLAIYWPAMPLIIHRVTRDESYIANMAGEVSRFNDELDALVERIRAYGQSTQVAA